MKRFFSIIIALAMLVGLLSATAVAVAEEAGGTGSPEPESKRTVEFNYDKFDDYVKSVADNYYLEMNSDFMFENKWWEDADKVHEIFPGINYNELPATDIAGKEEADKHDLTFSLGETAAESEADQDDYKAAKYWATERITLPDGPTAATEKKTVTEGEDPQDVPKGYFDGWKVVYKDESLDAEHKIAEWKKEVLYKAGDKISMPDCDVEIVAQWVETEEEVSDKVYDDKIYLLYVTPTGATTEDMKDWQRCQVTSDFSLTTEGEWNFRFAVLDGNAFAQPDYSFDFDDVLVTTFAAAEELIKQAEDNNEEVNNDNVKAFNGTLTYYAKDTTAPQIELSTTQQNRVTDGLTVGTTYSISTSLDITECSSTKVTYVVYKKVAAGTEGADSEGWLKIYDSATSTVTEGYEYKSDNSNPQGCISTSGVITPLAEDVTGEDVYKIEYTVVDTYGNVGVKKVESDKTPSTDEYHPVMLLKVKAAPVSATTKPVDVWKIVLYVIAGLSAVGIVVLLCIKPKQPKAADGRYNPNNTDENTSADDQPSENTDDRVE